ncbi:MAG: hypothetical protein ACP59X_01225 [Solidesulfovibrio sp. DCME]|uniref:hypothetical protein n=1 Tax=Solidesulfovibrio sp. DCME TaxID=3447380 RepID=UPI003D0D09D1
MAGSMTTRLGWRVALAVVAWCVLAPFPGLAQTGLAGWERGGAYDRLYRPEAATTLTGRLVGIREAAPLPGMAPGPVLTVRTTDGTVVEAQAGPSAFAKLLTYTVSPGDRLKIRGAFADVGGQTVFLVAKLRVNGAYVFKCRRTRDGVPYWSLSKETLIREKLPQ